MRIVAIILIVSFYLLQSIDSRSLDAVKIKSEIKIELRKEGLQSQGINNPNSNSRPIPPDAIKETDIESLTLFYGKMTTSRRNASIPQLICVGGSAGCNAFIPQVVQCVNKGFDGLSAQWRCDGIKDRPSNLNFGKIDVNCEGYENPNDPYVLKGSCALRYTIDYKYYGNNNTGKPLNPEALLIVLLVCGIPVCILVVWLFIFCLCKACKPVRTKRVYRTSTTNYNIRGNPSSNPPPYNPTAPPPPPPLPPFPPPYSPEFRNEFTYIASVPSNHNSSDRFLTGAAAGGVVGYLLGSRNNSRNGYHSRPNYSTGSQPSSTETRTVTGFGGTTRR